MGDAAEACVFAASLYCKMISSNVFWKYVPETYPQNTFEDMFYERKDLHYEDKRYTGRGQTNPFI